jgi:hypothetical protein
VERDAGLLDGDQVVTAFFCRVIIESRVLNCSLAKLGLLHLNNVGNVEKLVIPCILGKDRRRSVVKDQVRDITTGQRRDHFLIQSLERQDAVVEFVAAGLLVVRRGLTKRYVFGRNKALANP